MLVGKAHADDPNEQQLLIDCASKLLSRGVVRAAWVAGFVLLLAGCTQPNQTGSNSPEASPSSSPVTTTPGTVPTPFDSTPPAASPSAKASPRPAKLIITSLPYHMGEVGVTYGTVVLVAAGGVKPYKWSIQGGTIPPGLTLSTSGSTTGKPTTAGTFSFSVRVDDSAGAAAGAPSSVLVFRQLAFTQPTGWSCGNVRLKQNNCSTTTTPPLRIPYTGGIPGDKPVVKIVKVTGATISARSALAGCLPAVATTNPPPGMTTSASGGTMTLSAGPPSSTWCSYFGTIIFELVDRSPCGTGFMCVSSNTVSILFSL
jgi:hypothetical protein